MQSFPLLDIEIDTKISEELLDHLFKEKDENI